jgi:hypothetical protein
MSQNRFGEPPASSWAETIRSQGAFTKQPVKGVGAAIDQLTSAPLL